MKLSTKLLISLLVVIVLVGGIGFISSYVNESVKDEVLLENKMAIEQIELADDMRLQAYRSITGAQYLLKEKYRQNLSRDISPDRVPVETVTSEIKEALKSFKATITRTRVFAKADYEAVSKDSMEAGRVIKLVDSLEKKFKIYSSLIDQFQELSADSSSDGKDFFTVTIEPFFRTALLPHIEQLRARIEANLQKKISRLNARLNRLNDLLILATIIALIIAFFLAFYLYRSISEPLKKISRVAQSIGKGNLDVRIDYDQNNELGTVSNTFNNMVESLSRTTVSRDYVDSIIESMADLLVVTDSQYKITRINSAGLSMLGITEDEAMGTPIYSILNEDRQAKLSEKRIKNTKNNNIANKVLITGKGTKIPVSVSKGTLKGSEGKVEGYVIVASDITGQRKAQKMVERSLKEKELLLSEIHHRVKNNLAVISGLLQMQIWDVQDETVIKALQESQLRVRSIALVHEKLYQSENFSSIEFDKYLNDLLHTIGDIYLTEDSNITIETDFDSVVFDIGQAIPCALLLNELVVNAFEHAFRGREEGTIKILMQKKDHQITFRVKDNGKGFSEEINDSESLGMTLIDTLSKQLEGEVSFDNKQGVEATVIFETKKGKHSSYSPTLS